MGQFSPAFWRSCIILQGHENTDNLSCPHAVKSTFVYTVQIDSKNTGLELIQLMTTVLVYSPGSQYLAHV